MKQDYIRNKNGFSPRVRSMREIELTIVNSGITCPGVLLVNQYYFKLLSI